LYLADDSMTVSGSWSRADDPANLNIFFSSVRIVVEGKQPNLVLNCAMELECINNSSGFFIAMDLCNNLSEPIMQALPEAKPFIVHGPGMYVVHIAIELPPLIPGRYFLDAWVGSRFTSTEDYQRNIVSFEVTESPTRGRSYPHSPNHGFMVPNARVTCEKKCTTSPSS
jgi:lipopolysaccharide transport system ATP-binding protein